MGDTLNGRQRLKVTSHAVAFTLTAKDNGTCHVNTAAIAAQLPAATPGLHFRFRVGAALALTIIPAAGEKMSATATGVPGNADQTLVADAIGESVEIICDVATIWSIRGYSGTWTIT